MRKNIQKMLMAAIMLLMSMMASAAVPAWQCSFERQQDRTGWTVLTSGTPGSNTWKAGTATSYDGTHSFYITADGGQTAAYQENGAACITAYRKISLQKGRYTFTCVYKARGGYGDYLNMAFSTARPTSASDLDDYSGFLLPSACYFQQVNDTNPWLPNHPMWLTYTEEIEVTANRADYYLSFMWHTNGDANINNPGACVDFIQIAPIQTGPDCSAQPKFLRQNRQGNAVTFDWSGTASEYQIEYFIYDDPTVRMVDYLTQPTYTVHCDAIREGVYTFRVRSICGTDTSAWSKLDYLLFYDITKHCMDYLNFYDPDVIAQYGDFANPYAYTGVIDSGYWGADSRITRHYIPGETDPHTSNQLTTTPSDQVASIRLGNWQSRAEGEAVNFRLPITQDAAVLLVQYAVVMQDANHEVDSQPHFTLELLDSVGTLVDSCGFADFIAETGPTGWQTDNSDSIPVRWKDWTLIGMNMQQYMGQTLTIRLTTKDCAIGEHYSYAYFSLACHDGRIEGLRCGEKPDTLKAAPGFYYRWYRKFETPRVVLGREQTFIIPGGRQDTATYCVDLIQMLDTTCYFTIEVSALGYEPHADFAAEWRAQDCQSFVSLTDSSYIAGFAYDSLDNKVVITRDYEAERSYYWECNTTLGRQTSTLPNPRFRLPNTGDSVRITLTSAMEGGCEDVKRYVFYAPPVQPITVTKRYNICQGDTIYYKGQTYTESGDYVDTLATTLGCDSFFVLSLRYITVDTIRYFDTICEVDMPAGGVYWPEGNLYMPAGGNYTYIQPARGGCDSICHLMTFCEYKRLRMSVDSFPEAFCLGDGDLRIPYKKLAGEASRYSLFFDAEAHRRGFFDFIWMPVEDSASIDIPLSEQAWAGYYTARLVVYNLHCDSLVFPLNITLLYGAENVITQRWNDFLSVRQSAYDFYGGFTDYQWFADGVAISGMNGPQLYLPENGLDPNAEYSVEMTRLADSVRIRSCAFAPTVEPNTTTLSVVPSIILAGAPTAVSVSVSQPGQLSVFRHSGECMWKTELPEGQSFINPPQQAGLYILHFRNRDGNIQTTKIIVE